MSAEYDGKQEYYKVVHNDEGQYSLWAVDRENPPGWHDSGKAGPKAECLDFVNEAWTDMRPLSLRRRLEQRDAAPSAGGRQR